MVPVVWQIFEVTAIVDRYFVIVQHPFQMVPQFLSGELWSYCKNLVAWEIQMAPPLIVDTHGVSEGHLHLILPYFPNAVQGRYLFLVIWTLNLEQVTEKWQNGWSFFYPYSSSALTVPIACFPHTPSLLRAGLLFLVSKSFPSVFLSILCAPEFLLTFHQYPVSLFNNRTPELQLGTWIPSSGWYFILLCNMVWSWG